MKKVLFILLILFGAYLVDAQQFYKIKDTKILIEFFPNDTLKIIHLKDRVVEIKKIDSLNFAIKQVDKNGQIISQDFYCVTNVKEFIPNKVRINANKIIRKDIQYTILSKKTIREN